MTKLMIIDITLINKMGNTHLLDLGFFFLTYGLYCQWALLMDDATVINKKAVR